jgi:hypothetical protein
MSTGHWTKLAAKAYFTPLLLCLIPADATYQRGKSVQTTGTTSTDEKAVCGKSIAFLANL